MKVSEFEARLSTVTDDKLRAMYADSLAKGPEVAVQLIKAEADRRGLALEAAAEPDGLAAGPAAGASEGIAEGEAPKGAWLQEETSSGGLPTFVKILLALVVIGGIGAIAFVALNRG